MIPRSAVFSVLGIHFAAMENIAGKTGPWNAPSITLAKKTGQALPGLILATAGITRLDADSIEKLLA